eukprot:5572273-Pyramimonas_sp.AAC.1
MRAPPPPSSTSSAKWSWSALACSRFGGKTSDYYFAGVAGLRAASYMRLPLPSLLNIYVKVIAGRPSMLQIRRRSVVRTGLLKESFIVSQQKQ